LKSNLNQKSKFIGVSSSSSWSLWIFRKKLLEYLSKKNNLIILSKEKFFLKKIKIKNFLFIKHNFKFYVKNIFLLKNKNINKFIEYDIKNLIFHFILKIFINYELIVICAGLGSYYNKKGYFNFIEKLILKIIFVPVNKIIFINKYDKIILNKLVKKKNHTIPTEGYQLKFYRIKKKINLRTSFVLGARPIKEKGILEYIEVAKEYPQCDFYLYLIGTNKKKIFYNSKILNIENQNLPKNLIIRKNIQNFTKKIRIYDCLISNSYGEGFGNTIADATCSGLVVISTKTNGAKYIFKKKSLIWVKIKSAASLKKAIRIFLNMNHNQKTRMIKSARLDIKKININKVLIKLIDYL